MRVKKREKRKHVVSKEWITCPSWDVNGYRMACTFPSTPVPGIEPRMCQTFTFPLSHVSAPHHAIFSFVNIKYWHVIRKILLKYSFKKFKKMVFSLPSRFSFWSCTFKPFRFYYGLWPCTCWQACAGACSKKLNSLLVLVCMFPAFKYLFHSTPWEEDTVFCEETKAQTSEVIILTSRNLLRSLFTKCMIRFWQDWLKIFFFFTIFDYRTKDPWDCTSIF